MRLKQPIDPRSKSSHWRVCRALSAYKRSRIKLDECLDQMAREGLTLSYVERLLAPIGVLLEERRLRKNRLARERRAALKAAK